MSSQYRGVVKIAGSLLRGWLVDDEHPDRRVRFNLLIDGQLRGTYAANRRRRFFIRHSDAGEDAHGFSIPIRRQWISGDLQSIDIEDPSDPGLRASLSVRLGPAANTHFADNVVGGQTSIGGGERAVHKAGAIFVSDEDEETGQDIRTQPGTKVILKQIADLQDADLANFLLAIDRDVVVPRLNKSEESGDWHGAAVYRRAFLGLPAEQRLSGLARIALKSRNHELAARLASAAAALRPHSFEANLLAGNAKSAQGEFDDALRHLRVADRLEAGGIRAKRELVLVLGKKLRGEAAAMDRREELRNEQLALLRGLSSCEDAIVRMKYCVPFAQALFAAGRYDDAIAAIDAVLSAAPNDTRALMLKARALVARNRIADANAIYQRILEVESDHKGARMNLRILAALVEDDRSRSEKEKDSFAQSGVPLSLHVIPSPDGTPLMHRLARIPQGWICVSESRPEEIAPEALSLLDANSMRRVGYAEIGSPDGRRLEFWRRDALIDLAESGLLESVDDAVALNRWKPFYCTPVRSDTAAHTSKPKRGVAALVSRNGAGLHGGDEHFLDNVADHHNRQGFEPIVVGTRADRKGEGDNSNGRRSIFIGDNIAELRKFFLESEVSLVHAISGAGFLVAEALNYTNIPFVYGVHSWNEILGDPGQEGHFDEVPVAGCFRREFLPILSRATSIYANSRFTQKVIEEGFGVRCPIIYAVPGERD